MPFLVWIALILCAFGGLVLWRESRRATWKQALAFMIGIPGVYFCVCAAWEKLPGFYIPGFASILTSYVCQYRVNKRS